MRMWRHRACLGLALWLLAGCGGPAPRSSDDGFMGVTRTRCAQGDDGACRILRAMGS